MTYALDAALGYERRGFSVVPIRVRGKAPIVSWTEWQTRRPNETQIRMWWKAHPDAGVGIITGKISNLVVIDIDPGKGGKNEGFPHTDMSVSTGGGGVHLYYQMPEGGCGTWVGQEGVDVRGEGGLVVAPPTIHQSGEAYVWDPDESPGVIAEPVVRALVPNTKLKALTAGPNEGNGSTAMVAQEQGPWMSNAVLYGYPEGTRNEGIASSAGYYAGLGMPRDLVLSHCLRISEASKSPLDAFEVQRTVKSICDKEELKQRELKAKEAKQEIAEVKEIEFIDFDDYAEKYGGQDTRWLIPDFVVDNTVSFLYGAPGSYKTWVELDLAVSIASGLPFLGIERPTRSGRVLIFQQEDAHPSIAERISTIWFGREGLKMPRIEDGVFSWHMPEKRLPIRMYEDRDFKFTNPNAMENLERTIQQQEPVAIFMDPFYSLVPNEDNMERAPEYIFGVKALRDKYNCSFFFVHHTNKAALGSGNRQGMLGSQLLNAFIESGMQMHNIEGLPKSAVMQRRSKDGGPKTPMRIDFDIFDADSETPGEWRYNTRVCEIDEARMKVLINPERDISGKDDEDMPSDAIMEKRAFALITPNGLRTDSVPKFLGPAMHRIMNQGRVRWNKETGMITKVLTL